MVRINDLDFDDIIAKLAEMLAEGFLDICNGGDRRIGIMLNCGDTMIWGGADCYALTYDNFYDIYEVFKQDSKWRRERYCCFTENMQPMPEVKADMIAEGAWDAAMEALPLNDLNTDDEE